MHRDLDLVTGFDRLVYVDGGVTHVRGSVLLRARQHGVWLTRVAGRTVLRQGKRRRVSGGLQLRTLLIHKPHVDRQCRKEEQHHQGDGRHDSHGTALTVRPMHFPSTAQMINQPPHRMAASPLSVRPSAMPVRVSSG